MQKQSDANFLCSEPQRSFCFVLGVMTFPSLKKVIFIASLGLPFYRFRIRVHFLFSCLMLCWSVLLMTSVCDVVLIFYFEDVSDTFVYECLEFSGCCLGYSPCFLVVVLV